MEELMEYYYRCEDEGLKEISIPVEVLAKASEEYERYKLMTLRWLKFKEDINNLME